MIPDQLIATTAVVRSLALLSFAFAGSPRAQDSQPAATRPGGDAAAAKAPEPILPIPDYSGDLATRRYLSGDWDGTRSDLANKGIQVQLDWNQYVQGITQGGRDRETRYGGKGNYLVLLDLQRMGAAPGALVKFRAESRYEDSVNADAGPLLPVNTDAFFPLTRQLDEDIPFTITNLVFNQFFSEQFGVFLGKLDTLDGDPNEFASGRGTTQFMNSNFVFNSALALRLPYSTLGAGFVWMPSPTVRVLSTLVNTVDSSTTTGFDDFGDGMSWSTEVSFQHRRGTLPGGTNLGFLYSFDQDFTKVGGRLVFNPGQGFTLPTEQETWAAYWSSWQYFCVEDPAERPVDLANGEPDHQGVGFFARFGFADEDTNPVEWSASGGIGGRGLIPSRDDDTFGVGYFFTSFQTLRLTGIAGLQEDTQGLEVFYNIALTRAARLTLDVQVVEPAAAALENAVVLGARLGIGF